MMPKDKEEKIEKAPPKVEAPKVSSKPEPKLGEGDIKLRCLHKCPDGTLGGSLLVPFYKGGTMATFPVRYGDVFYTNSEWHAKVMIRCGQAEEVK
jgi:hypothetical protein